LAAYSADYPDLAETVKVWVELPGHLKVGIRALVQAHISRENK
jgi:hypothetical protein